MPALPRRSSRPLAFLARPVLGLGLGLLLAGCAGGGTSPAQPSAAVAQAPPLPYPPSVRARLQRIVMEEWQEWGRIVVEDARPRAATPRGSTQEGRLDNFPRVLAYWRAVEEGRPAIDRNRARYANALALPGADAGLWSEPAWSAAFVSYVMRNAGVDQREFPSAAAHAFYIDGMLADAVTFPAQAPFVPRDVTGYAPAPGDLVCADRSRRNPLTQWRQRLAETGQFRPMHCDIVVATGPGTVEAVGGNIADAVTLSRLPADSSGRLLPRAPGQPTWFAVFENRLGRLAPFGSPYGVPVARGPAGGAGPS